MAREVLISELKIVFFVRTGLDEDRVLQMAMSLEAGEELPAIKINENKEVIDGRHRIEAYKMLNKTHIPCDTIKDLSRGEQIIMALKENMGGALPPTRQDIRLAIQNMVHAGVKEKAIKEGIPLPPSIVNKYIREATSNIYKARLSAAVQAVSYEDIRVQDAADKYDIDVEELREAIRGKKKEASDKSVGVPKIKAALSKRFRSSSQLNATMCKQLMDGYMDGDVSYKTFTELLELTATLTNRQLENLANWKDRLETAKRNLDSPEKN